MQGNINTRSWGAVGLLQLVLNTGRLEIDSDLRSWQRTVQCVSDGSEGIAFVWSNGAVRTDGCCTGLHQFLFDQWRRLYEAIQGLIHGIQGGGVGR
jgi:hypothetical protein